MFCFIMKRIEVNINSELDLLTRRLLKEHSLIAKVNMIRTPNMKIECPLPYYNSPSSAKL